MLIISVNFRVTFRKGVGTKNWGMLSNAVSIEASLARAKSAGASLLFCCTEVGVLCARLAWCMFWVCITQLSNSG